MIQNNRGGPKPPPKKKSKIKICKDNTLKSLNDVECFLNDFQKFNWYVHFLKLFK